MNLFFRLWLTLNATLLLISIFCVQSLFDPQSSSLKNIDFLNIFVCFIQRIFNLKYNLLNKTVLLHNLNIIVLGFVCLVFPVFSTYLNTLLRLKLSQDVFKKGEIKNIEYANNVFLPSYLGYFFVALSINDWKTLVFVYIIIFIFTFCSQELYFNPLLLVLKYNFYTISTQAGSTLFLISKKNYKKPEDVIISKVYRINNSTFIE